MKFKRQSEWIVDEEPDVVFEIDWERDGFVGLHPIIFEQKILSVLRVNQIPVLGDVEVSGIAKGRLYWNDFENLGRRTYYYHRNEPTYTPEASDLEYNICRLVCPICKELCGGISDHVEQTDVHWHGCMNEHRWLAPEDEEEVCYSPSGCSSIVSKVRFTPKKQEPITRGISFED